MFLTNDYDLTLNDHYHRVRSTLQIGLGATWHTDFNNDKQHLFVSIGYEFNEWFQQNELRELTLPSAPNVLLVAETVEDLVNFASQRITNSISNSSTTSRREGDLGLQGLTFDVRFDF